MRKTWSWCWLALKRQSRAPVNWMNPSDHQSQPWHNRILSLALPPRAYLIKRLVYPYPLFRDIYLGSIFQMSPQFFILAPKQCIELSYGRPYANCTVVQLLTKVIPEITQELYKAEESILLCMCLAISHTHYCILWTIMHCRQCHLRMQGTTYHDFPVKITTLNTTTGNYGTYRIVFILVSLKYIVERSQNLIHSLHIPNAWV